LWLVRAGGWLWAVACSGPSVPPSTARLLARDQNSLHMETKPRHAAAQVTLLESSFIFLPCQRQVPLVWVDNSSSEQHSFGKLPMLLPLGARNESSSEHSRASSSEHNREAAAELRASAVACISSSRSSVWLAPSCRIKVQSRFHQHPDPAAAASCKQQQRRTANSSSNGEQPCASSQIRLN
jgi:hypothetical protein